MIAAATRNVPEASFEKVDIKDFKIPADGKNYDAITVYFSLIASVTQDQIRSYIAKIHTWLKDAWDIHFRNGSHQRRELGDRLDGAADCGEQFEPG